MSEAEQRLKEKEVTLNKIVWIVYTDGLRPGTSIESRLRWERI